MTQAWEIAFKFAAKGRRVFPLHSIVNGACSCGRSDCASPGKHPRSKHGVHDATADDAKLAEWLATWPEANIGLATGDASGIFVLDVDPRHGGIDSLEELAAAYGEPPPTFTVKTGSGGFHLYFKFPAGKQITIGTALDGKPGVDWRGNGGYVVAPGSTHISGEAYLISADLPMAEMPDWLVALVEKKHKKHRPASAPKPPPPSGGTPYGLKALAAEANAVRGTHEGMRNHRLNMAAFNLGQLAAGGELAGEDVERELLFAARACGLSDTEALATIASGFSAGIQAPRSAPPRNTAPPPAQGAPDAQPPEPGEDADPEEFCRDWSHDALALDLVRAWGPAKYVQLWGSWLFWTGTHWQMDEHLRHMTKTREFLRIKAEDFLSDKQDDPKARAAAKALRSARTIAAVVQLARSDRSCAAGVDDWDPHPFLLGTPGGVVDLKTGKLRPADPDDKITKLTACAPAPEGSTPVLFVNFMHQIADGRPELVDYLQRFLGYSLTGDTGEHAFVFGFGAGQNGKSVLLKVLGTILDQYASSFPPEMLMVSHNDRHPAEIARLRGVRLAIGSETEDGRQWAESKLKQLTGGDKIAARFMRQDWFEFVPRFKVIIAGNHVPGLRGVGKAMRRRLHFVPFDYTVPDHEVDHDLTDKLVAEGPAILRWLIDGCLAWQREGLKPPALVLEATDKYMADEDVIVQWIEDCATWEPANWQLAAELWTSWRRWADTNGETPGTQRRFAQKLVEHGLNPERRSYGRGYTGLKLKPAELANGAETPDWRER